MTGRHCRGAQVFAFMWFVGALAVAPASAAGFAGCRGLGQPFAIAEAAGARDALTIRLADGREVRLAGIAVPADFTGTAESARRAIAALDAMVAGRRVALHGAAQTTDRYGRLVAQVTVIGATELWPQGELLLAGMAYASPESATSDCATALVERENAARRMRAGLWRDEAFAVKSASATQSLRDSAGGFAVIEGTVLRVGEAGGRLFLDFGRHYSRDFSLVVPREAQAGFAKAGLDLRGLSGKRVRVRGVLFDRGGPAMELRTPAALEIIGTGGA